MNVHNMSDYKPSEPKPKKKRTISLTGRNPIRIIEEDWPPIVEALVDDDPCQEAPWGWSMTLKVRRHVDHDKDRLAIPGYPMHGKTPIREHWPCYIVHATYSVRDESKEDDYVCNQTVRVGHLLNGDQAWRLDIVIKKVGDELRERIRADRIRPFVINLIDDALGKLEPTEIS